MSQCPDEPGFLSCIGVPGDGIPDTEPERCEVQNERPGHPVDPSEKSTEIVYTLVEEGAYSKFPFGPAALIVLDFVGARGNCAP